MNRWITLVLGCAVAGLVGCGSSKPKQTGYLSDYSRLQEVSSTSSRYFAPRDTAKQYTKFIVDPVEVFAHQEGESDPQLGELAAYFRTKLIETLQPDYPVVDRPGQGVARLRIAITDVKSSKWYLSLHPASKLTGAGAGEAAMEGELVDSVTGAQIAALVESQRGSQFELDTFSKFDDSKDVINDWCSRFRERLDELHDKKK